MSLEVSLRHRIGAFTLDVEFLAPGGVTALFGRSGAGKSTVAAALAGLLNPDEGRVALNGRVLTDTARGIREPVHKRRIGMVFQDGRLFPHMSVARNLDYGAPAAKQDKAMRERVIEMLGLGALLGRRPDRLSGGEAQRVSLGRALLSGPDLLVMDEPLSALDVARKEEILPYLERLRDAAGMPIVYISHAMSEVARLADTLVMLEQGRVVRAGPLADLLSDPALVPGIGVREAGAVVEGVVLEKDAEGLASVRTSAGTITVPGLGAGIGATVRIRILAQDVILAAAEPVGLSAMNVLEVEVVSVQLGHGGGAAVRLRAGSDHLLARITARSAQRMNLVPGLRLWAILKATAIPRGDIGLIGG